MFEEITTLAIFHFFLVFSRFGSAFMLMPGFGEIYVPAKARLAAALSISFVMAPAISPLLPPLPANSIAFFMLVFYEILIGVFIGGITRLLQAILHVGGMIIAFQSSLAAALLFDANQGSQGSVVGNFMTLVGLTLLFASDLHHVMLWGVSDSYHLFQTGNHPPIAGFAELAMGAISGGFLVAFKIASPLIVVGLMLYLSAGLMGRLMPNMQVFFVLMPLQIYIGFTMVGLTLVSAMTLYLSYFEQVMTTLFGQ